MATIGLIVSLLRSGAGIGWPLGGGVVAGIALAVGIAQVAIIGGTATALGEAAEASGKERQRLQMEWDAPTGFSRDQIDFEVTATTLEHVPLRGVGSEGRSENEAFVVRLSVANRHKNRRLVVRDLQEQFSFGDRVSLEDSAGNRYAPVAFGIYEPTYQHGRMTVDPDSTSEVALFFERPVEDAEDFVLSIPASRFEGRGTVKVMFQR